MERTARTSAPFSERKGVKVDCHFRSGAAGGCWDDFGSHGALGLGSYRQTLARLRRHKNVGRLGSSRELGTGTGVGQGILSTRCYVLGAADYPPGSHSFSLVW